jgi:hypothetical protein
LIARGMACVVVSTRWNSQSSPDKRPHRSVCSAGWAGWLPLRAGEQRPREFTAVDDPTVKFLVEWWGIASNLEASGTSHAHHSAWGINAPPTTHGREQLNWRNECEYWTRVGRTCLPWWTCTRKSTHDIVSNLSICTYQGIGAWIEFSGGLGNVHLIEYGFLHNCYYRADSRCRSRIDAVPHW